MKQYIASIRCEITSKASDNYAKAIFEKTMADLKKRGFVGEYGLEVREVGKCLCGYVIGDDPDCPVHRIAFCGP